VHPKLRDALLPYLLAARRLRRDPPRLQSFGYAQPRSFSQFGEDRFLLRYFRDQTSGFYVDVGASHPFSFSNTYLLYERGWRGLNLEPAPDDFALLRRHRPRDVNLPIAVSSTVRDVQFSLAGTFGGIVDEQHMWAETEAEQITLRTQTLSRVLAEHLPTGQQIDLLDVDCEGHDLDVLRSNEWETHRPRLILAEAHGEDAREAITTFLGGVDYRLLTRIELTLAYERCD
jgi:FkbM family methyltransferase